MQTDTRALDQATEAVRKDVSLLRELDVDAAAINQRSAVFERTYTDPSGKQVPVFVKVYTYRTHLLERLWRAGRSRIEARNLIFFKQSGIPAARVIAWGERKNAFGKLVEEFIITEAVPNTQTLDEFVSEHCPDRSRPEYGERRDQLLHQLGQATARIHAHSFFHKDLKWRNVLARLNGDQVETFWIDCPKGDFHLPPWPQEHGKLKDCATLDKIARFACTQDERKRFVAHYLGKPESSEQVAESATAISDFRKQRFDPKDDEQRLKKANAPQ